MGIIWKSVFLSRGNKKYYFTGISSLYGFISIFSWSNGCGRNHRNFVPGSRKSVCAWNGGITIMSRARILSSSIFPITFHSGSRSCSKSNPCPSSNINSSESFHKSVLSNSLYHTDFVWKWFPNGIFAEWTSNCWTEKSYPLYSCIDLRGSLWTCWSQSPILRNKASTFSRTFSLYGKSVNARVE